MECAYAKQTIMETAAMCIAHGRRNVTNKASAPSKPNPYGLSDRDGQCECVYGFSGKKCDVVCNRQSTCFGHGDCVSGGYCMCDAGYEGEYCEKKVGDYSMVVLLLVVANLIVAFMWYRGRVGLCLVW